MKQLKIILLIIGTIIGAGFVSGKEISSFFCIFGFYSYIFIIPIFFFFFYLFFYLLFLCIFIIFIFFDVLLFKYFFCYII